MSPLALVALAAWAASAPPQRKDLPIEIAESGEVSYEPGTGRWLLSGGARIRRGEVTLRAARAAYDPRTGEVDASGGVLLSDATHVLSAASLHAVIDGPFEAHDVVAFTKEGPFDLGKCRTLEEARATGRNRVTVRGSRVLGEAGSPRFAVSGARVTLCDCGAGPPSWEIRASRATVVAGSHAWLTLPVLWVTPRFLRVDTQVPVFAFPFAYVPLAERQSGLLLPEVAFGRALAVSQPLFLALSESWDATVTLDGAFGAPVARLNGPLDVVRRSVRGMGSSLELRWAPSETTSGRARLLWLRDTSRDCVARDPATGACAAGFLSSPHGDRLALTLLHQQRLAAATDLRAELGLVNDPLYTQDFTADLLLRAAEYRRSSAWVARRLGDGVLSAEVGYHLALGNTLGQRSFAAYPPGSGLARVPYGLFGGDVPLLHRLPSLAATLLPVRIAGPLALSASASVARFAPLRGPGGDEGTNGVGPGGRGGPYGSSTVDLPDAGQGDGAWQPGERLAGSRAAVQATLRAPVTVGEWAGVEPWATGFAAGYAFDAGPNTAASARGAAGVAVSTRLTRPYGRWRHEVEPRAEWRIGSGPVGASLPAAAWDELDAPRRPEPAATALTRVGELKTLSATPRGGFQQATFALRNRVHAGGATALALTVAQDLDLERGRLAEASVEATALAGPLRASAEARIHPGRGPDPAIRAARPSPLDPFSLLRGTAAVADRRGDDVHGSIVAMGPSGSERLAAGLEPLLDPRPAPVVPVAFATAGVTAKLSGATMVYDAAFRARTLESPICAGGKTSPGVYQHSVRLGWDSPCKCFKVAVTAVISECDPNPSFGFQFGFQQLGERRFAP